jgi:hypothetical protein
MAHLFIRVELRGSPSWQDYENLHAFMEKNNWFRKIRGTIGESALPHATCHGDSGNDISVITRALRKCIQANVWTQAIVLTIRSDVVYGAGVISDGIRSVLHDADAS